MLWWENNVTGPQEFFITLAIGKVLSIQACTPTDNKIGQTLVGLPLHKVVSFLPSLTLVSPWGCFGLLPTNAWSLSVVIGCPAQVVHGNEGTRFLFALPPASVSVLGELILHARQETTVLITYP